jgi:hypothetical protein
VQLVYFNKMSTFKTISLEYMNINNDIKFINNTETVYEHITNVEKHNIIDDASILANYLWSANKINNSLNLKENLANKNIANGYAGLTNNGVIPNILLPPLAITKPILYADLAARDSDIANVQEGDVAIVTDVQKSYIYSMSGYIELITTGSIASINGLYGGAVQINTAHIPEITNLYYTESRVSANLDLVNNTNRIVVLENDTTGTWYESESSETCIEVFPSDITEISSSSKNTSFTPIAGTYRVTFNAQFELRDSIIIRVPAAINSLKDQLNALTYTSHVAGYVTETLFAGNYYTAGATTQTGVLTLDAQNDPNATFVIKCGAAHAIATLATTNLINGAQSSNVFYYVVGALSAGADSTIIGTFIGDAAIGIAVGCTLDGRLFTTNGAITTGNDMGIPSGDTYAFDLGVSAKFVLFDISGDITNPSPTTNPTNITSGIVACGNGTVTGFDPYDGIYPLYGQQQLTRAVFGIYNDNIVSPSSVSYIEKNSVNSYYNVSIATTIINTGGLISARIGIDSDDGSVVVTNRTLYGIKLKL